MHLPHSTPQELEQGKIEPVPVYRVKHFLDDLKTGLLVKASRF